MSILEAKVYEVGAVTSPNGEVNGKIALVDAAQPVWGIVTSA